jgi:hypothetical protein
VSKSLSYSVSVIDKLNVERMPRMETALLNSIKEQSLFQFYKARDRIDSSNMRQRNNVAVVLEEFSAKKLVNEIKKLLFHSIKNKQLQFTVNWCSSVPDTLYGDKERIT